MTEEPRTHPGVTPATVAARLSTMRREIRLPDGALILRGGTLQLGDLEKAVLVAEVKMKRPGLSVYGADVPDPQSLLDLVAGQVMHASVSFTTVECLREKGFELEQTGDPPHHTVWLPETDDREYWLREFRNSFELPRNRDGLAGYSVGSH
ncbi:hypothetical protein ASD10_15885 [Aeromicrobium sp. Root472D3]|nr:hypothetical protein ASD10_15885 [Aeromicrobium sp. Root472D3]